MRDDPIGFGIAASVLKAIFVALAALPLAAPASAIPRLPADIIRQLPAGYEVIASARIAAGHPMRRFEIVALGRKDEKARRLRGPRAPARPLLVFERTGGRVVFAERNDRVVMRADDAFQCDPFLDGGGTIATKGRYFTVENSAACGAHWTDYITFRLDDRSGGFVFDNERRELWHFNPSNDPDAEALVRDGPPRVIRDRAGHLTAFPAWRPRD